MTRNWKVALLAATVMTAISAPATAATRHKTVKKPVAAKTAPAAGTAALRAQIEAQQAQIDALTARLNAMPTQPAAPVVDEEAAANAEFLKAQVDAQQAQIEDLKKQTAANAPTFGAAPTLKGSGGFSFKPTGEIQYDAGYVSNPNNAINTGNLGFNNRSRRLLIGAQGDLPGDFKYSFQFNFSQAVVDYEDVTLSYEPKGKPYSITIGYFYPYNTLENLTSNRFTSFVERAAMTDAFSEGRRLGIGLGLVNKTNDLRANIGVFANAIGNANYDNNDYEISGRVAWSPLALGGQLHLAGAAQYRRFKTTSLGLQYRARPYTQITDQRFTDTGAIASKSDQIYGVELAGIWGPLHVAGEGQIVKNEGYRPGTAVNNGIQPGQILNGALLASNPTFYSAYGEVGYWLTGETRGYRNGKFDRTKILNGFDKGGWGGFQVVGRVDYLNLRDTVGGTGANVINGVLNGGRQTGYLAALNWWPIDYVRFTTQYTHTSVQGGPRAGAVLPLDSRPVYDRRYGVDAVVVRAQVDF